MKNIRIISSVILSAVPAMAFAHATMQIPEASADSYYLATLQVPHGCDGKATTEVQIKLPEGFIAAKPQPKAGWEIEIIKGKYQKSYDLHGKTVTEGPVEIRWKNGNLPDEYYDTFTISGKFSGIAAGTSVPFVSTQLCGSEGKVAWTELPAEGQNPHDLKNPAPTVTLTAGEGHDHHGMEMKAAEFSPVKVGALELSAAFIKAMTPGQPVGGGFVTIANNGKTDDRLVSVSPASGADHVELHEMKVDGDVMRMRKLNDGIALPAGKTTEMKPGGLHMMFMGVKKPFMAGDTVKATFVFEKAGTVEIEIPVVDRKGGMQHKM
ncbi:DUF1775 domain-containing protein [Rhizobium sp. KVB221]|uniref:DUF1775 domain-containing protein n=1 Tax=Rhizobium setariae TaxID=2801340 RepID=A0A936YQJ3_9HYPH|nr:DUF1775 domain-containing protein [Rhizobium setariae]MBL0373848.1 DUF1775 domain-containing protein [Rhizobium setariae]